MRRSICWPRARSAVVELTPPRRGEIWHRRLAEQEGAGGVQLGHDGGVLSRNVALERRGAEARLDALGLGLVFDAERDAVQRPHELARLLVDGIQLGRSLERRRVERHVRVERRALLVVCSNAIEVQLGERHAGEGASLVRRVDVCDCRLFDLEHGSGPAAQHEGRVGALHRRKPAGRKPAASTTTRCRGTGFVACGRDERFCSLRPLSTTAGRRPSPAATPYSH